MEKKRSGKKTGPKPADRSAYFEEAREILRHRPGLTANAVGDKMQQKYPGIRGLGQAIRKQLKKEERATASPSPPVPASPAPLARSVPPRPRKRLNSLDELFKEAQRRAAGFQSMQLYAEKAQLYKQILEKDLETLEALKRDPTFMEMLRMLYEDED